MSGMRHGHGRYTFTSGDVYAGEWVSGAALQHLIAPYRTPLLRFMQVDDRRTGHGTFFYVNGDVFVGNWIRDRKEGRGTLFMMARQVRINASGAHVEQGAENNSFVAQLAHAAWTEGGCALCGRIWCKCLCP